MTIARAIQDHLGTSAQDVAATVGEHPAAWSLHVSGRRDPTSRKVQTWCQRAGVALTIHPDGALTIARQEAP